MGSSSAHRRCVPYSHSEARRRRHERSWGKEACLSFSPRATVPETHLPRSTASTATARGQQAPAAAASRHVGACGAPVAAGPRAARAMPHMVALLVPELASTQINNFMLASTWSMPWSSLILAQRSMHHGAIDRYQPDTRACVLACGCPACPACAPADLEVDGWLLPSLVALHHRACQVGHVDARVALTCRGIARGRGRGIVRANTTLCQGPSPVPQGGVGHAAVPMLAAAWVRLSGRLHQPGRRVRSCPHRRCRTRWTGTAQSVGTSRAGRRWRPRPSASIHGGNDPRRKDLWRQARAPFLLTTPPSTAHACQCRAMSDQA